MNKFNLTKNSLEKIMTGGVCERPIVQVLGHKKILSAQGPDRYRLLLSDGIHSVSSAMLATQLNDKVTEGQIDTNAVIQLDKYICNVIQGEKRVIVLLELTILATGPVVGNKIGNPQSFKQPTGDHGNTTMPQQNDYNNRSSVDGSSSSSSVATNSRNFNSYQSNTGKSNQFQGHSNSSFGGVQHQQQHQHQQQQQQQQQQRGSFNVSSQISSKSGSTLDTPSKIHPISSLNPYQNRWTIKARVTQKSGVRTWSNSRGEGQLFSMNLLDESGEIRATAFKNEVDKFHNMIEVNKVYFFRKAQLKAANKQFSNLNNDYEMTFTGDTEVILCDEEDDGVPTLSFNFIPFNKFEEMQPNAVVDVIGIVKECEDLKVVISKQNGKEIKKKDVSIVDQTQVQIRLTLWGSDAETFDGSGNPVLVAKGCRLSDWGGRSLSQSSGCQLLLNPDIPESHALRGWFDHVGCSASYMEFKRDGTSNTGPTAWKTFTEVKAQNLGMDKAEYFCTKAAVSLIKKDNCLYMACPQADCNKKAIDLGNGKYRCEKCAQEFPNFKWRLLLQLNLSDFTDNQWVTCFQDSAEAILKRKADEIGHLKESNPIEFDQIFNDVNFGSFIFKLRAKMESFNDETRLKVICMQATPVNYADHSQKLLDDIEKMLGSL